MVEYSVDLSLGVSYTFKIVITMVENVRLHLGFHGSRGRSISFPGRTLEDSSPLVFFLGA